MPVTDSIFDNNQNVLFVKEVNWKHFLIGDNVGGFYDN